MPKFPEPPPVDDLRRIGPELVTLPARTSMARIFFRGGPFPTRWNEFRNWGPGGSRFDHHLPDAGGKPQLQPRAILYAASAGTLDALSVCAAEVFQANRIVHRTMRAPWFVVFETVRDLSLLDLTGAWPTRAGASSALSSGSRARARRWSRAIYDAYPDIDGLLFPSSMGGNSPAYALYERAADALPPSPSFHRALADPALTSPIGMSAVKIGYRVL